MVSGSVGNLKHLSTQRFLTCKAFEAPFHPMFPDVYLI